MHRSAATALLKRTYLKLAYPPSPPCHAVLEPLIETGSVHTRLVMLLERIADSFRLARVEPPAVIDLTLTVYGHDGRQVCRQAVAGVAIAGVYVWESRDAVPPAALPVEGTVLVEGALRDTAGRLIPQELIERVWDDPWASIAEFTIDWYQEGAFITTSHVNIPVTLPPAPVRQRIAGAVRGLNEALPLRQLVNSDRARPGTISVWCDDTFESSLVYYSWLEPVAAGQIWAEVRNCEGESRRTTLPALGTRSCLRLPISEIFPDAARFFGGRHGNLLLDRPLPLLARNPRFYVQTSHRERGGFGIDHAYLEHARSGASTPLAEWRRSGKGLHSPCTAIERPGSRTGLALFNMVDVETPKSIGVLLYDREGHLVVDKRPAVTLGPRAHGIVWVRDLLDEVGHRGDFFGHAEVLYCMEVDPMPDMLHHQVLYVQPGMVEGVQHMVGLWNSPRGWVSEEIDDPQQLGRRGIRAPAYATPQWDTLLGLTNCSHAWEYDVTARVELALTAGPAVVERTTIDIPPHGTWLESITRAFPSIGRCLARHGGIGVVEIRPLNVRTLGAQYFHVDRATGHFSSEHTF